MITSLFFEGLITEFGMVLITGTVFSLGGLFFEFGNNYRPVFVPRAAIFESGKKCPKPVPQSLMSIFRHFLIFYTVNIAQYNTHTAHTIHNTQPHTAYKTHNTSARHITSHDIT